MLFDPNSILFSIKQTLVGLQPNVQKQQMFFLLPWLHIHAYKLHSTKTKINKTSAVVVVVAFTVAF
jgi:hypothetical protein